MYKVSSVSVPALRPTSPYNGLLCENTVFAVWFYEKGAVTVYEYQSPLWTHVR